MNDNSSTQLTSRHSEQGRISRKRARTRAELLAAARVVFSAHGFHDASIAQITAQADVGVGTFYLHFRDKEEIFSTLLEEGFDEIREGVLAATADQPLEQLLPTALLAIFRQAYIQRDLFQIALTDGGNLLHSRTIRARLEVAESLTHVLTLAQESDLLISYDIPLLARFITGMVMQGIGWWFEHDTPGPDEMTARILQLLRGGLPPQLLVDTDQT
ncbi:MAG: TetR/AcrR family transcriptional regulator [Ktedonobacteraceae bacterium]